MEYNKNFTEPSGLIKAGYTNPNKPGVVIENDTREQSAYYAGAQNSSTSQQSLHFATPIVVTELLSASTRLISLVSTCPELANTNLEILQDGNNVLAVKAYVNNNRHAFTSNLDTAIKKWSDKTNFHPSTMFATDDMDDSIMEIISALYAKYKKRCSNSKTTNEDEIEMNKCIKMLLEIKVLGLQKELKVD